MTDITILGKVPPHNIEAEQACLGVMLLSKEAVVEGVERLKAEDFYKESHRQIFKAIVALFDANEPVDIVTVSDYLRNKNLLDEIGGPEYLASLPESVPSTSNFSHYVEIIIEKSILRKLISSANQIISYAMQSAEITDIEEVIDRSEQLIFEIGQRRSQRDFVKIGDIVTSAIHKIDQLYRSKRTITGIPSGLYELDKLTSGFQKSDFIVIAARPSVGKTSLGLNIAEHAAAENNIPVAIFSLEMSSEQLFYRILSSMSKVNLKSIRTGIFKESDWNNLTSAASMIHNLPIYIDDSSALTLMEIRAKARRAVAQYGVKLIIIDYLQLINLPGKYENRQQEISVISRSLKALAKELDIPIIAISQLSRKVEERKNKKPQLSDLRESGAIEQDADVVIFLHRPDIGEEETEKEEEDNKPVEYEIIVAKQRNGPTGERKVYFFKNFTKFVNYEYAEPDIGEVI